MLTQGSWLPENRAALEDLICRVGRESETYDPLAPPFAVFDWDQTVIRHDIGDALFLRQIEDLAFAHEQDEFWSILGVAPDDPLRDHVARLLEAPQEEWPEMEEHHAWRDAVLLGYLRSGQIDPQEGFPWQTRLLAGLTVDEVKRLTRIAIEAEVALPLQARPYTVAGSELRFHQGLRPYAEILELMRALEEAGIAAWVVSATNIWSVQAMAEYLGLRTDRVIGMRTRVGDGVITSDLEPPVPATWGKVLAIQRYIHPTQPPVLVAGDNITDLPMLEYSADTRLVIDRGVKALSEVARARQAAGERWLVQPQFHVE
ncbi:MAG: haloacid dehalogenase-like hydrolase [Anaerolineae bacterium]